MPEEYMLTTADNPFNPFTQFDEWNRYDTRNGHHTLSYLALVVRSSSELSEADQASAIDQAIDEIVNEDVFGLYLRVTPDYQPTPAPPTS